jgi:hypothetical protein
MQASARVNQATVTLDPLADERDALVLVKRGLSKCFETWMAARVRETSSAVIGMSAHLVQAAHVCQL